MQEKELVASSHKECNEVKENLLLSKEKVVQTVSCMHIFTD